MIQCLLLASCVASSAAAEFRFRVREDMGTLDWGYGEVPAVVVQQLMEGLTVSGKDGEPLPGLAERWETTAGLHPTYAFHLRKTAVWSDGRAVCATDFIDAWTRARDPAFASPYAHYFFDIRDLKAEGCATLRVTLERPVAFFPSLVSHWVFFPVRNDLISAFGKAWTDPSHLAVTGPYRLKEWAHDRQFTLEKNPRYHGAPAREATLRGIVVADDVTALRLFKRGGLDWTFDLPQLEAQKLATTPEFRVFPTNIVYFLGFRMSPPNGFDRDTRCSLAHGINKALIPRFLSGTSAVADTVVPPELAAVDAKAAARKPPFTDKRISRTPVELFYYSKDAHVPLIELVQENWRHFRGVRAKVTRLDSKSYWARLAADPPQVFLSGTTAPYSHPFAFLSEFLTASRANWGHFSSPEYDEAALRASTLPRGAEREKWVRAAEKILIEKECAVVPLYFRRTAALVAQGWTGFFTNPMGYVYLKDVGRR